MNPRAHHITTRQSIEDNLLFYPTGSKISCGNLLFLNLLMKVSDSSDLEDEKNASAFFEPEEQNLR